VAAGGGSGTAPPRDDPDGYRAEFVRLVELADSLSAQKTTALR
jgi:hypothetical protein